ncbi:MarR family winged helix-turn-helix transcriptional regulator [Lentzea nigeriaca]|uniref:MarR family winged helix-turn-helix transcriptional regulator n=1 Tax=Lentzea nigeriaca TaxID=1128665 RepID=UPI00195C154F|nr:MarR family transcriptional regulator [Lentzea nigeriaca]MBM7856940.1 DNA-binding MarR family transcriptional regulator [Lentzea nigeriaca]
MADLVTDYRLLIAEVYELAGLSRRISEREAAENGTTVARWHILSVVAEEPLTVPAIGRRLGLVRQAVQRVADDLVEAGQLRVEPNPAHRRSMLYAITPEGTRVLERLWAASEPRRLDTLAGSAVTADDLRHARTTLRHLIDALTHW